MNATNNIATDLFYKIRSRFEGLKLGTAEGTITINPEDARFFDFDYVENDVPLGHISISLAEENSMKVYFSTGITEGMDDKQKTGWYSFLRELRSFAKRRLMAFDTRDIAKDNLDKRDYAFLSQHKKPKPQTPVSITKPVGESIMSESQLYGSKTVSYQKLMDTRLIIKHSQALADDMQPGARSRNISALFVENQEGERFKYPFIHLAGARAMQRHVANGGLPYDEIGRNIISMSEEIAQLKSFSNYVVRNDLMNTDTNDIVSKAQQRLESLRETITRLSKQSHYESFRENFQNEDQVEVPEEVIEDYTNRFTVKNFKEDIKAVFPVIYKLMQENNSVDYEDIVNMTTNNETDIAVQTETVEDPFEKFEAFVMALGEESAVTSDDEETKIQAVKKLQDLVGQHFPAGVDGSNAIESLKGVIEDPQLFKQIKDQSKEDPDSCVRGLVKDWLEQNAPEVVDQLDFGDFVEEPAAGEEPQMSDMDQDQSQKLNIQELAEFIHSFYDQNTGTFPKGPEGVCTMVGKKFGEQAEQVARKFVERMAPQQSTEQNPELAELSRVKELAGLQTDSEMEEGEYSPMDQEILKLFKKFDNDANEVYAYGDPDVKKALELAKAGKIEDAAGEIADAYSDQDGGEVHAVYNMYDDLVKDLLHVTKSAGNESLELEQIKRLSGIAQGISS
jgi:hypothetical protein